MQIRDLKIRNFRGIAALDWRPTSSLVCIVGPGDVGKSTVLDAVEAALSSRWLQFSDADFLNCDQNKSIEIMATVGELPADALQERRMGLSLRGWTKDGKLRDEPQGDDEAVVTIRLTVDSSLDPVWELITDRGEPRTLSARDRSMFGVVRLGGDAERHLTWGQGSALSRLSNKKGEATSILADAYRKARELIADGTIPELKKISKLVHESAVGMGAYSSAPYVPGLDTQRASMSLGTLALHSEGIPVRLAGLGTRRLVTLAIQRLAIPDGAVILIDELEHGLEPHRIRHAIKILRAALADTAEDGRIGQVIMTTHSTTSLVELSASQLAVARRKNGKVELRSPAAALQPVVRRVPEAFLAQRVIVSEGKTEVGLLRGMRDYWRVKNNDEPIEYRGVVIADGGGSEAPRTTIELSRLGYQVAIFRDSDRELNEKDTTELKSLTVSIYQWADKCATEDRVFRDVSDHAVQKLLKIAYQAHGSDSVRDAIRAALGTKELLSAEFETWKVLGKTKQDLRQAIADAAKKKGWYKLIESGEMLGTVVAAEMEEGLDAPLATLLRRLEKWAYV